MRGLRHDIDQFEAVQPKARITDVAEKMKTCSS